jgi:hypothetical protein
MAFISIKNRKYMPLATIVKPFQNQLQTNYKTKSIINPNSKWLGFCSILFYSSIEVKVLFFHSVVRKPE